MNLRKGRGDEVEAADYYDIIDPAGKKRTLQDWWAANGFVAAEY